MDKKIRTSTFCMLALFMFLATFSSAQTMLEWGDQGNGTYKNPILNADYSDPDVIRVGEKYYMVASDFHYIGMQVLESSDMVNWKLVSQIYSRFNLPGWDSNNHYAGGSWAPSIRWHNNKFYVYFCTPDEGLFMTTADDACGPWEPLSCIKEVSKWEDPCPLFDDDGQVYLGRSQHGAGPIIVHKMSADGSVLLDDGVTVYTGPVAEGTKWLKLDGWYYLIIPEGGVGQGWQTVLRSKNVYGPYEKRVVLEQGSTLINGPHQGALVDTPDGRWWFFHFQDTPVLGRVVHLQPARWKDGWPLMGVDIDGNGIGEPVMVWTKPVLSNFSPFLPQTSDDFSSQSLGLQWQWCHNPDNDFWSLNEKRGWLAIKAQPSINLRNARNMLTQKSMGFVSEATTLLDCANLGKDAFAGILCIGKTFRGFGVCKEGICLEIDGERKLLEKRHLSKVWLRVSLNAINNKHRFSYSLDGKRYISVGDAFEMRSGFWKGIRVGLFCYGNSGMALFDFFNYDINK